MMVRDTPRRHPTAATRRRLALVFVATLLTVLPRVAATQSTGPLETFTATTTNMRPDGQELKIDVLRWSSESDREAVISWLTGEAEEDAPLTDLPTTGYVWPRGSGLGYSVKYAYRVSTPDGGQHITLVTGRPLGRFDRERWQADDADPTENEDFTVIELRVDEQGNGSGTMSLATGFSIDTATNTVSLESYATAPTLITSVARVPQPYWAADRR